MSGPADGNITLRDRIDQGVINGPRIIPSGRVALTLTPEEARAEVRKMATLGVKFTGEIGLTSFPGPTAREMEVLRGSGGRGQAVAVSHDAQSRLMPRRRFASPNDAESVHAEGHGAKD